MEKEYGAPLLVSFVSIFWHFIFFIFLLLQRLVPKKPIGSRLLHAACCTLHAAMQLKRTTKQNKTPVSPLADCAGFRTFDHWRPLSLTGLRATAVRAVLMHPTTHPHHTLSAGSASLAFPVGWDQPLKIKKSFAEDSPTPPKDPKPPPLRPSCTLHNTHHVTRPTDKTPSSQ